VDETRLQGLAERLDDAVQSVSLVSQLTLSGPLDLAAAYRVQRLGIGLRAARGDRLIGMKMGLTSRAKMAQVGVHEPIYAHLTETMRVADGAVLVCDEMGHPRAEPEVAFLLGEDLSGPTDAAGAMKAVTGLAAAIEVIDSRYRDFKFALADVVADNASSCRFAIGEWVAPQSLAEGPGLANLDVQLVIDGEVAHAASTAAILGDPAESLAFLANMLADVGESLKVGMVVLAGAATPAVHLQPGMKVTAHVEKLGSVGFSVA